MGPHGIRITIRIFAHTISFQTLLCTQKNVKRDVIVSLCRRASVDKSSEMNALLNMSVHEYSGQILYYATAVGDDSHATELGVGSTVRRRLPVSTVQPLTLTLST